MQQIQFTDSELVEKTNHTVKRYPNLNTVLMVENFLKTKCDSPIKISNLKRKLPKQVMHQTLQIILKYLFISGKIIYGPRGVQWIYSEPNHIKKMMENTIEL
jgi:hypothetical protein